MDLQQARFRVCWI